MVLSLLLNNNIVSQNRNSKFGISASSSLSGAGFGIMYTPAIYYKINDFRLGVGLNIQKRNLNISGSQINFEYTMCDEEKKSLHGGYIGSLELYAFSTVKYSTNSYLSNSQILLEKRVAPDNNLSLEKLKFSAAELYAGFGLKIRITKHIKWGNSIGFGGWRTLTGENSLYREYNSVSIYLNTCLSFDM
jgi:hypothetical protein